MPPSQQGESAPSSGTCSFCLLVLESDCFHLQVFNEFKGMGNLHILKDFSFLVPFFPPNQFSHSFPLLPLPSIYG